MRKNTNAKKLALSSSIIRNLNGAELSLALGGQQQSRGCTQKNSACNACPEVDM